MKPITLEWVDKAEGDYRISQREFITSDPVYDAVCFHSQQCAEKYFKALLIENNREVPRTHDLMDLSQRCHDWVSDMDSLEEDLLFLTHAAVETRYPGISSEMQDAERCMHVARRIREALRRALGLSDA